MLHYTVYGTYKLYQTSSRVMKFIAYIKSIILVIFTFKKNNFIMLYQ